MYDGMLWSALYVVHTLSDNPTFPCTCTSSNIRKLAGKSSLKVVATNRDKTIKIKKTLARKLTNLQNKISSNDYF